MGVGVLNPKSSMALRKGVAILKSSNNVMHIGIIHK
jgi:hypothetical protein